MMDWRWIAGAAFAAFAVCHVVKMVCDMRHFTKVEVPRQLVELVLQAHSGEPFTTKMDIQVSSEMWMLCACH